MKAKIYLAIHLISVSVDTFVRSQPVTDLIYTALKKSVKMLLFIILTQFSMYEYIFSYKLICQHIHLVLMFQTFGPHMWFTYCKIKLSNMNHLNTYFALQLHVQIQSYFSFSKAIIIMKLPLDQACITILLFALCILKLQLSEKLLLDSEIKLAMSQSVGFQREMLLLYHTFYYVCQFYLMLRHLFFH